jgi:hypothetical protein
MNNILNFKAKLNQINQIIIKILKIFSNNCQIWENSSINLNTKNNKSKMVVDLKFQKFKKIKKISKD